jgi:hypothetical protein
MRIRPGIFIAVVAVLAVLFTGRYLGWFGKRSTDVADTPVEAPAPTEVRETTTPPPPAPPAIPTMAAARKPTPPPGALQPAPPTTPTLITDWEQRIDDVLGGKEDETLKAKKLLEIFPNMPEEGQVEAAQHISNLLPDEQYPALAQTLTNAHTSEAVLDVLMTDVLNRPNAIKLNTLLEVARTPDHPKAEEARDVLEVFVDEDYGQNWTAWSDAVQKWLKENPDEQ